MPNLNTHITTYYRAASQKPPIQPIKIAVIEEHPAVRLALLTRFRESPIVEQVVAHFDLESLQNWRDFDVLLIGLPLLKPDVSTLHAFVRQFRAENIPVIALTSYAHDDEYELMLSAGVMAYLLKNIDTQHLIDRIMNIVYATAQNENGRG